MLPLYMVRSTWLVGIVFFAALVLSCWRRPWSSISAAVLYALGILIRLGFLAYAFTVRVEIGYGASDSGSANSAALWGLVVPVGLSVYAVAATVLLWPTVSQEKALLLGKILHLCFFPPLVLFLLFISQPAFAPHPFELSWLVYPVLWFRIREGYAGRGSSQPLLATAP
jgi:hypothetical protein